MLKVLTECQAVTSVPPFTQLLHCQSATIPEDLDSGVSARRQLR